jgi:hypothetical protein
MRSQSVAIYVVSLAALGIVSEKLLPTIMALSFVDSP